MSTQKLRELNLFQDRLIQLRGSRTKAEFARFIGVSAPLYHQWEGGATPTYNKAVLIAQKCDVPVEWLLNGKSAPTPKQPPQIDWKARAELAEKKLDKLRSAIKNFNKVVEHLEGAL